MSYGGRGAVVCVAFKVKIAGMHLDNGPGYSSGLRVPADSVADITLLGGHVLGR